MSSYPYLTAPEKIPLLFDAVMKARTPDKFTYRFLESMGFKSSRERELLPFLKSLGFLEGKGRPVEEYDKLKNRQEFETILRRKIERAYRPLFALDAQAAGKDKETLQGYFGQLTGEDLARCENYAETFLRLVDLAKMGEEPASDTKRNKGGEELSAKKEKMVFTINIHLPETEKEEVYEAIFKGLSDLLKR